MSKLTDWSFRNKAAVILIVIMALAMGVVSYLRLPMEFLPAANNPQITVTAIGPGYDAKAMEGQVTDKLEEALMFAKGKTVMFSSSGTGYAQVNLNFDAKTDMKEAKLEVERAVAQLPLPQGVMPPFVTHYNTSMIPIAWITLTFDGELSEQQKDEKLKQFQTELQKTEGAGVITTMGQSALAIHLTPLTDKLAELNIPLQSLMGILQGRGISASIGEREIDGAAGNMTVYDEVTSLETLRGLPVAPGIKLSDVAKVEFAKEQESISRMNGKDAILFTVSKASDANAVTVGKGINETVERVKTDIPGIEPSVILSTSDSVVSSVNSMLREVLLGALFATIVILLFMRNFRATIVTIVSIPLSLGITLYLLQLSGVSLNIITLGGVAVAVGRLVDDSIVVIENIYRRLQKEPFSLTVIKDATKEVAGAITASTLVTVAVFLPMGLLRGTLQAFLLPFALTVAYSLLASLLVALTVVPLLSGLLLKGTKEKPHEGSPRISAFIRWNLKHKAVALTIAVVLFAGSIGAYIAMPKGALDSSSAENVTATLAFPSDTPRETVLEAGKELEAYIMADKSVKWVLLDSGNSADMAKQGAVSSPTQVNYTIDLKPDVDADLFIANVKAQSEHYPDASLTVNAIDLMMGGGSSTINIDITGEDTARLDETAQSLIAALNKVDGVLKVQSNQEEKKPVYAFKVDPAKAAGQDVAMQLQSLLNPLPVGSIRVEGVNTPVMLQPAANPGTEAALKNLTIMTENGPQPVSSVTELSRTEEPSLYYHKDGKTYVRVTAEAEPSKLSIVGADINKAVNELKLPEGVKLSVGGASADQMSDFADLGVTALISIGLVYLIMVLAFKTLRAPLAIMFSLPLAAIGAVIGLLISGITPDFTAMFGALMLIGIVVTNAIVLIDRVKQNETSMPIREALIEAATTRMRPIVMTAVATICAMLPLLFGSHESGSIVSQSLAIVVIGGLTAATLLTIVIVPCIYELLFFRASRKERRVAQQSLAPQSAQ
ncbi:efflux RND transporter permease subunit [Paenibacillus radicis (ex Gao et al. 2016)]|uniref:Multidrug transporter AcrB n=1 Tax=Paenibacillus radicis (ex Gao et al. 2016) TaxID=1737354 RepID=A0A917HUT1_9BACL|nr:efflux RND transporter permease subunit [Paenibacillus radicis (ex Gao et al. 2016)]GGG89767.1 multidrug transporter AcrB [Paenibacillus radicis (ex Gao et al. 2016)]